MHLPTQRSMILLLAGFTAQILLGQTQVQPHWSPYDYPKSYPESAKLHIVQKGDTLWQLAAQYHKNAFLWPQLYNVNSYIKDPDLIYPGDPILLDIGVVVDEETVPEGEDAANVGNHEGEAVAETAPAEEAEPAKAEKPTVAERTTTEFEGADTEFVILPAGDRSDMECAPYLLKAKSSSDKIPVDFLVLGGENKLKYVYNTDDIVYLNKGAKSGIKPGEEYSSRRSVGPVYHPDLSTQKKLASKTSFMGFRIEINGRIRVISVQDDAATAIVVDSCSGVRSGDFLVPYEQEPIPLITDLPVAERWQKFNREDAGYLLFANDDIGTIGNGNLCVVNLGVKDNLTPGDILITYRPNPNKYKKIAELPPLYLGHMVVLKVDLEYSVVKVIEAFMEFKKGDRVISYAKAKATN